MLEVSRLNAAYGRAHVLFDLQLEARTGEVSVLLGRNGAGKSTTLKSIMGLLRAQAGEIRFDGRRIERLQPYQIARLGLGYVPEDRRSGRGAGRRSCGRRSGSRPPAPAAGP